MRHFFKFLTVALGVYCLLAWNIFPKWHDHERFVHAGTKVMGKVTAKETHYRQVVCYEYVVESISYSGKIDARFGKLRPFSEIKIGDEIPITYWEKNPSASVAGDSYEPYKSWSGILFLFLPSLSLIVGVIATYAFKKGSR